MLSPHLYVGEDRGRFPGPVVRRPEAHLSPAVSAAVAGGAVQPVAVVARPCRAHRAGRGVVRLAGGPPAVHGEEGVTDVVGGPFRLRELLSLRELVEAPLDVEKLRAGLVSLHRHHGGVTAALQSNSVNTPEGKFHLFYFDPLTVSLLLLTKNNLIID